MGFAALYPSTLATLAQKPNVNELRPILRVETMLRERSMRHAAWLVVAVFAGMVWHVAGVTTKDLEVSDTMNVMQLQIRADKNLSITPVADFM
jgi:hypothetical protein